MNWIGKIKYVKIVHYISEFFFGRFTYDEIESITSPQVGWFPLFHEFNIRFADFFLWSACNNAKLESN